MSNWSELLESMPNIEMIESVDNLYQAFLKSLQLVNSEEETVKRDLRLSYLHLQVATNLLSRTMNGTSLNLQFASPNSQQSRSSENEKKTSLFQQRHLQSRSRISHVVRLMYQTAKKLRELHDYWGFQSPYVPQRQENVPYPSEGS